MFKVALLVLMVSTVAPGITCAASTETDSELFSRAEKLIDSEQYEQAAKAFQSFIDKFPYSKDIPYAICEQALAYIHLGEYQKAEANFNKVNKDYSYLKDLNLKVQYGLAECSMRMGNESKATQIYDKLMAKEPSKTPDIYYTRGAVYYNQKKWDQAVTYLKKMAESSPNDKRMPEVKFMLATCYKEQGKYKQASEMYDSIARDPGLTNDAYFSLGQIAFKEKDYSKAVRYFRGVKPKSEIFGDKTNMEELARYQIVLCYFEQARVYETWITCEDFLEKYPESKLKKDVCRIMIMSYLKKGNAEGAVRAYESYAKLDPEEAKKLDVNYFIAESFYERGEFKEAVEYYNKQLSEPGKPELSEKSHAKLAECYFSLGDYSKSAGIYRDYLEKHPDTASAPYFAFRLAYALTTQKDYASAVKYYKLIEEKYPSSEYIEKAIYNIGWCYSCLGDPEQAQSYYKKFIEKYPTNKFVPSVIFEIGNVLLSNKQYAEAAQYYKQITEKYPESEAAQSATYRLGVCYLYSSRKDEALGELKKFLTKNPESPLAPEAIRAVYDLYLKQKKYSEGIEAFKELVKAYSGKKEILAELYGCLANLYYISGDMKSAASTVNELLSAFNNFSDTLPPEDSVSVIGQVLAGSNEGERSIQFFNGLLSRCGEGALAEASLYYRGRAYMSQKDFSGAIIDLKELLSKYPGTKYASRAKLGIADSYYNREIISEAVNYYNDVLAHYRDDTTPQALFQLGNCYFARNKYDEALNYYQRVAILYPHHEKLASEALSKAGECRERLGVKERAGAGK